MVKNLSIDFCKIPEKDCSNEALHQAKKKKGSKDKEVKEKNKKSPQKGGDCPALHKDFLGDLSSFILSYGCIGYVISNDLM